MNRLAAVLLVLLAACAGAGSRPAHTFARTAVLLADEPATRASLARLPRGTPINLVMKEGSAKIGGAFAAYDPAALGGATVGLKARMGVNEYFLDKIRFIELEDTSTPAAP